MGITPGNAGVEFSVHERQQLPIKFAYSEKVKIVFRAGYNSLAELIHFHATAAHSTHNIVCRYMRAKNWALIGAPGSFQGGAPKGMRVRGILISNCRIFKSFQPAAAQDALWFDIFP